MESLTPENNQRNPWFGEYWEEVFNCILQKKNAITYKRQKPFIIAFPQWSDSQWTIHANQSFNICSSELRLNTASGYEQESKVQFVVDAVYAFALALNKLHHDLCGHDEGLCSSMANYDRGAFYKNYLLNVAFVGESDVTARRLFVSFVPFFSHLSLLSLRFFLLSFVLRVLKNRRGRAGEECVR